jgi:2-polyprenyl-3-methyl-5-hydroxy-6-metoxy-1,4-benzoquinol methylase
LAIRERAKESARRIIWRADRRTTTDLRRRFVPLDPLSVDRFRDHVLENWSTQDYWDSDVGRRDIEKHTLGRLIFDRHEYVRSLNGLRRLDGARVFEIGCGTGSSVMALIERGADVTGHRFGAGIHRGVAREVALLRPRRAIASYLNGTEIDAKFDHASFDFVISSHRWST